MVKEKFKQVIGVNLIFLAVASSGVALSVEENSIENEIAEQIKLEKLDKKNNKNVEISKNKQGTKEEVKNDNTSKENNGSKNINFLSSLAGALKKINHALEFYVGYSFDIDQEPKNKANGNQNKLAFGAKYKAYYNINDRISLFSGILASGDVKISGKDIKKTNYEINEQILDESKWFKERTETTTWNTYVGYEERWVEKPDLSTTTTTTTTDYYYKENSATQVYNNYFAILQNNSDEYGNILQENQNKINPIIDQYITAFRNKVEDGEITLKEVSLYTPEIDIQSIVDNNEKKVFATQDILNDGISDETRDYMQRYDYKTNKEVSRKVYFEDRDKLKEDGITYNAFRNNDIIKNYYSLITGLTDFLNPIGVNEIGNSNGTKDDLKQGVLNYVPEVLYSTDSYTKYFDRSSSITKEDVTYHNNAIHNLIYKAFTNDKVDPSDSSSKSKFNKMLEDYTVNFDSSAENDLKDYINLMISKVANVLQTSTKDDDIELFGSNYVNSNSYNYCISDLINGVYNEIPVSREDGNDEYETYSEMWYSLAAVLYNKKNISDILITKATNYNLSNFFDVNKYNFILYPFSKIDVDTNYLSNVNKMIKDGQKISDVINEKAKSLYSDQSLYELAINKSTADITNLINTSINEYNTGKEESEQINIHAVKDFGDKSYTDWYEAINEYKTEMETRFKAESSDGGTTITEAEQAIIDNTDNQQKYAMLKTGLTSAPITDYVNDNQNNTLTALERQVEFNKSLNHQIVSTQNLVNKIEEDIVEEGYENIFDYASNSEKTISEIKTFVNDRVNELENRVAYSFLDDDGTNPDVYSWNEAIEEYRSLTASDGNTNNDGDEFAIKYAILKTGLAYDPSSDLNSVDYVNDAVKISTYMNNDNFVQMAMFSTTNLTEKLKQDALSQDGGYTDILDYVLNSGKSINELKTFINSRISKENYLYPFSFAGGTYSPHSLGFTTIYSKGDAVEEYKTLMTAKAKESSSDGGATITNAEQALIDNADNQTKYAMLKTGLPEATNMYSDNRIILSGWCSTFGGCPSSALKLIYVDDGYEKEDIMLEMLRLRTQNLVNKVKEDTLNEDGGYTDILDYVLNSGKSIDEIKTFIKDREDTTTPRYATDLKAYAFRDDDGTNPDFYSWNEAIQDYKTLMTAKAKESSSDGGATITDAEQALIDNTDNQTKYAMLTTGLLEDPKDGLHYYRDDYVNSEEYKENFEANFDSDALIESRLVSTNNLVNKIKADVVGEGYSNIFDYVLNSGKSIDEIKTFIENRVSESDNRIAYAFRDYGTDDKYYSWDEAIAEYKALSKYDGDTSNDGDDYVKMYAMLKTGLTQAPRDDYDQSDYVLASKLVLDYATKAKAQVDINNNVVGRIDNHIKSLTKTDGTNYSSVLDYVLNSGATSDQIENIITSTDGYDGVAQTSLTSGIYATSYTTWDSAVSEFYNNVENVNSNVKNTLNSVITNTAKQDGTNYASIFDYVSNSGATVDTVRQIIETNTAGIGKAFLYNENKNNAMKAGTNNWTEAIDEFKSLTINDDNENNNTEEYAIMYAMLKTGLYNGSDNDAETLVKYYAMLKTAFVNEPKQINLSENPSESEYNQTHIYLDQVTEYNQSVIRDIQNEYLHQVKLLNADKVADNDRDFFVGTADKIDYSLIDTSWFENSQVIALNNDINSGDGYLSWDEAIQQYKDEMKAAFILDSSDGGTTITGAEQAIIDNTDNQQKYAMLKTGLKERPTNFANINLNDTIGLTNVDLTTQEGQLKYALADRYVKIYNNNLVSNEISNYVNANYGNQSVLDVVKNGITDDEVNNILNNVNGVNNVVAIRTQSDDNYINWEEAFNYYKEEAAKDDDTTNDTDAHATRYAMLKTGLKLAPTDEDLAKDPLNIYDITTNNSSVPVSTEHSLGWREKEIRTTQSTVNRSGNITTTTTIVETKIYHSYYEDLYEMRDFSYNTYDIIRDKTVRIDINKIQNEYMNKEKVHFALPFGVKIKINNNFSIEPYGLAGFNIADSTKTSKTITNTIIERTINDEFVSINETGDRVVSSDSKRKTNVGFTGGAGINFNFWKDRVFAGAEYRYALNKIQDTNIHSHNVGLKVGYRFNF